MRLLIISLVVFAAIIVAVCGCDSGYDSEPDAEVYYEPPLDAGAIELQPSMDEENEAPEIYQYLQSTNPNIAATCGWGGCGQAGAACCGACFDPVPPPPNEDVSHALNCCACSTETGGCGNPAWCDAHNRMGNFDPCPGGLFCVKCKDISASDPEYSVSGHSAGADGECNTEDDTYIKAPST